MGKPQLGKTRNSSLKTLSNVIHAGFISRITMRTESFFYGNLRCERKSTDGQYVRFVVLPSSLLAEQCRSEDLGKILPKAKHAEFFEVRLEVARKFSADFLRPCKFCRCHVGFKTLDLDLSKPEGPTRIVWTYLEPHGSDRSAQLI